MGEVLKNKITYDLDGDISNFFTLPIDEEEIKPANYNALKNKVYKSNKLDSEEKATIINKINSLNNNMSHKETKKIIKEIEELKNQYNL